MAYDVVIFDLDGTLLDTLDDLMDSCNYALSTIGAPPRTRAEIRRFVGNGIRNLMLQAVPDGEANPKFEQAYETMQTWYKAHNQIKTAPYPGVQQLIRTLSQQGVPMAVVSNKPDSSVQMLVEQWFPEITFGLGEKEGLRRKPERDMVDYAIAQLGQTGKKAVYVGDSEVDLATAANAGLDCISSRDNLRHKEREGDRRQGFLPLFAFWVEKTVKYGWNQKPCATYGLIVYIKCSIMTVYE